MKPIIRDQSVYGGGGGAGVRTREGGRGEVRGGVEFDEQKTGVMAAAAIAKELLTSKKTYRVTVGILYSVLIIWLLFNLIHMVGNIGKISEPEDFWRHTRRLVKKSASIRKSHCCCDPVAMGVGEEGGETASTFQPPGATAFQEKELAAAATSGLPREEEEDGGEQNNEGKTGSYYVTKMAPTHVHSDESRHSPISEKTERGGVSGAYTEKAAGGGK